MLSPQEKIVQLLRLFKKVQETQMTILEELELTNTMLCSWLQAINKQAAGFIGPTVPEKNSGKQTKQHFYPEPVKTPGFNQNCERG